MPGIDTGLEAITKVNDIGFIEFTSGLITGVFDTLLDATLKQLQAYSQLVQSVSMTLDQYVNGSTLDADTCDAYLKGFGVEDGADTVKYQFDQAVWDKLKTEFAGVKVKLTNETSDKSFSEAYPENPTNTVQQYEATKDDLQKFAKKKLATAEYNLLVTVLKLGMQKLVVSNGFIRTKLTFHVDATEMTKTTSTQASVRSTSGSLSGGFASRRVNVGGSFSASSLKVKVVNESSVAATNLSVDVIGEVQINFRSETFPAIDVASQPQQ
jgi:hypothetical protein